MSQEAKRQQLESDLDRWKARLPQAEGTYCQGIANKAFGVLELLFKQVLVERLEQTQVPLSDLLNAVRYRGNVQTVEKLPPGTLIAVLLKLAEMDDELSSALPPPLRQTLRDVVPARNDTTHEVLAPELRERTSRLLDLIHKIVTAPSLAALLP